MRYALFFGEADAAKGGWEDYQEDYLSMASAKERAIKLATDNDVSDGFYSIWEYHWAHIVDIEARKIVWRNDEDA